MKNVILIMPFVFAFILVTGVIVYLNSIYNNIFQFDFTPKATEQSIAIADSLAKLDSLKLAKQDSLEIAKADSLLAEVNSNVNQTSRIDVDTTVTKSTSRDLTQNTTKADRDSAYAQWLKRTVRIIENLPPAQASKLLKNFSDNQARDIIYAMKQKQAAKIIAYLEPEYVHKLTRFQ